MQLVLSIATEFVCIKYIETKGNSVFHLIPIPIFQLSVARSVSVLCRTECKSLRRFQWLKD